MTWLRSNC